MAICPIIVDIHYFSFYYLARALMHNVACEFACAETISVNVLKVAEHSFARAFADAIQRAHKDCKKQTCRQ